MIRKLLIACLVVFLVIVLLGVGAIATWWFVSKTPVARDEVSAVSYKLEVPVGMGIKAVASELEEQGIIRSKTVFYLLARRESLQLKAGVYPLLSSMDTSEIFSILESGRQENLVVSIPEGLTLSKIASLLEENDVISAQEFLTVTRNPVLLAEYEIPAPSFEGYLFPDTYYFSPGMDGESVLRMLVDNFCRKISQIGGLADLSADELFDVVRLASIVEREYQVESEAPLIASVFKNRLEKNIGLYSCATIVYIITEIEGRPHPEIVTNKDLKLNSPYNTYMWSGLPPGPISNPGFVALDAVAHAPDTPYYYFRVTGKGDGSHHFSEDFQEHIEVGAMQTKRAAGN